MTISNAIKELRNLEVKPEKRTKKDAIIKALEDLINPKLSKKERIKTALQNAKKS